MQKGKQLRSLSNITSTIVMGFPHFLQPVVVPDFILTTKVKQMKIAQIYQIETLFKVLQQNIYSCKYHELKTQSFFDLIMKPVFS